MASSREMLATPESFFASLSHNPFDILCSAASHASQSVADVNAMTGRSDLVSGIRMNSLYLSADCIEITRLQNRLACAVARDGDHRPAEAVRGLHPLRGQET